MSPLTNTIKQAQTTLLKISHPIRQNKQPDEGKIRVLFLCVSGVTVRPHNLDNMKDNHSEGRVNILYSLISPTERFPSVSSTCGE